jgi:hypothetical protein
MQIPAMVREIDRTTQALAAQLGVGYTNLINGNGLYAKMRTRRDPINTNKKIKVLKVQLRREGEVVFVEIVPIKGYPSELLITKLALLI